MKIFLLNPSIFQFWIAPFLFSKWNEKRVLATKLKLIVVLSFSSASLWAQPPHTYSSDNTLFVPAGVTSMDIEGWGAGGGGGEASGGSLDGRSGGGGGGGAYVKGKITVVPGTTLNIKVPGISASGVAGGNATIIGFESVFFAAGGKAGTTNNSGGTPAGGKGGLDTESFGSIKRTSGVDGGSGSTGLIGLLQGSGAGGKGGDIGGGAGGAGITSIILGNASGKPGSPPGGGGSGAMNSLFDRLQVGGTGAAGQININYSCPSYGITGVSASPVCSSSGNTTITLASSPASLPIGVYTVTYNLTSPASNGLTVTMNVLTAGSGSFVLSGFSTAGTTNISITKLTSGACFADFSSNNTASIVVSSPSVGGTVGGGTTICSGSASGVLALTGNTGTVLNWESSLSPFSVWNRIDNTATTYTSGPLSETTRFRAVVKNGGCTIENSAATTVTVTPRPIPTFSAQPAATVCVNTDVIYTTQSGQVNYIWTVPGIAGIDYTITSGGIAATDSSVTLHWISPGNKTVTVSYSSNSCAAVINASNTTSVTKTERGVVNGGLHICSGSASPLLTLNSYNGTIVRWEYAEAIPYVWQPINHNANTYQPGILTTSTSYRAVVKNGTCPEEFAIETRIDVDPKPLVPTLGAIVQPTCINPTGSIVLTGLFATNWTITQNGTFPRLYSGSGTDFTISNLAPGTYSFTIHENSSCPSLPTVTVEIQAPITNIWDGAWSEGPPINTESIEFAEDYESNGNLDGCSCKVNAGKKVTIKSGHTLTIENEVVVESGANATLIFENNASLVQKNNVPNTGNIIYYRNSMPIRQADYVYWSSPVTGQTLAGVSPLTKSDKYYSYNGTKWVNASRNDVMTVGKGYIIRGPETFSNTIRDAFSASFTGIPNNGDINGEAVILNRFYLIGNPYPSALDADKFILANNVLEGTLYFWTHNTPVVLGGAYEYASDDYASYNLTGGVRTAFAADSGDNDVDNIDDIPSGKIGAGQSFFAEVTSSGTIVFNNLMREGGTANSQFFKPGKNSKSTGIEKHRVWLNMTNDSGAFKQTMIGYVEGATNGNDKRFDGVSFDGNQYLDFYSVNDDANLVIQGRALPFSDTDLVPLGYRTTISDEFTISIEQADGNLTNQAVYLEDKKTGGIYDLRSGNYKFTTEAGIFGDRFVLRYTNKSLGIDEIPDVKAGVIISVMDKVIRIQSANDVIKDIYIFDVSGKLLFTKKNVERTELHISNLKSSNQVLLIKVILENNFREDTKIIF